MTGENFNYDIDNANSFMDQLAELVASEAAARVPVFGEFLGPMMGLILGAMSGNRNEAIEDFVKRYCDYKVLKQHVQDLSDDLEGLMHQLEDSLSLDKLQDRVEGLRDVERNIVALMPSFNFHSESKPTADETRPAREVTLLFASLACFHLRLLEKLVELDVDERSNFKTKAAQLKLAYGQHAQSEMPRAAKESTEYLIHADQYGWNYWPDPYTRDLKREVHWSEGDPRHYIHISGQAVKDADLRDERTGVYMLDVGGRVAEYEYVKDGIEIHGPDYRGALTRRSEKFYYMNAVYPITQVPLPWDVKSVAMDLVDRYYASDKDGPNKVMPLSNDAANGLEKRFITVVTQRALIVFDRETKQFCETSGKYNYKEEIENFPSSARFDLQWSSICYTNKKLILFSAKDNVLRVLDGESVIGKLLKEFTILVEWDRMESHKPDEFKFYKADGEWQTYTIDSQGQIADQSGWQFPVSMR